MEIGKLVCLMFFIYSGLLLWVQSIMMTSKNFEYIRMKYFNIFDLLFNIVEVFCNDKNLIFEAELWEM